MRRLVLARFVGGPCNGVVLTLRGLTENLDHILVRDDEDVHVYRQESLDGSLAEYEFDETIQASEVESEYPDARDV